MNATEQRISSSEKHSVGGKRNRHGSVGTFEAHAIGRQRIDGYMFDVEILAIARRLGYGIQQVPVRWRDDADSRLDLVSGNLRNVRDIFRIGLDHRFRRRAVMKARLS